MKQSCAMNLFDVYPMPLLSLDKILRCSTFSNHWGKLLRNGCQINQEYKLCTCIEKCDAIILI